MDNLLTFSSFTNLYSLSKTLRFKLVPIGKTYDNIVASGILDEDRHRAESYKKVKVIIDDYHKAYIESVLDGYRLPVKSQGKLDSLEEYFYYYHLGQKSDKERDTFKKIQAALRKCIAKQLKNSDRFARISKKELIQQDLIDFVSSRPEAESEIGLISEFKNFTVYFTGFHENRANMYSEEEKSTAIAYRLINENLPKFVDNIDVFRKIANTEIAENFKSLYKTFEEYLQVEKLEDLFSLDYFSFVLTQKHIDVYNAIIGGKTTEQGDNIQGLNQLIYQYNQRHKAEKLPKLKFLFKQILSDKEALSWLPEQFDNDAELLRSIKDFYEDVVKKLVDGATLKLLMESIANYDLSGIFIRNDQQLTEISQRVAGGWSVIPNAVKRYLETQDLQKKRKSFENYEERIDKLFKSYPSFSIAFLDHALTESGLIDIRVEDYFRQAGAVNSDTVQKEKLFARITNAYTMVESLLNCQLPVGYNLAQDSESVALIKQLLDSIKELQLFIKPLLGTGEEADKNEAFYGDFCEYWNELDFLTLLYNKVRNYLTKKPYSEDKIKLNFKNPTLLDGWESNKENDYKSFLLKKGGLFYLGIINKCENIEFKNSHTSGDDLVFDKMEFHLFKVATMIPKCSTQLNEVKSHFNKSNDDYVLSSEKFVSPLIITKEIFDLNNRKYSGEKKFKTAYLKKTGDKRGFDEAVSVWIRFCMNFLKSYKSTASYNYSSLKPLNEYRQLDDFYLDVNKLLYSISFNKISGFDVMRFIDEGKLYLFQIYNKDFSSYSRGTPNMHTLYWKMLFDERNLADVVYKLDGKAEVFFRKASLQQGKPTHPANIPLKNKNSLNPKSESVFAYDLIKDKRYTVDQFQLHVPVTLNFKAAKPFNINQLVNDYIHTADDLHVIGIDRGERHLLYLVVIDSKGKICEQFSLNEIVNECRGISYKTNYHDLLDQKEQERLKARKSWQSIANIKELKEGYLSQVIHKIAELMVKYKAIVVLEDLNTGFKRGRQKVEKQVYQNFEKMLIEKLNFLAFKSEDPELPGGILHAYQLTNEFKGFKNLGKQSGFLFYIPAWNTSKIDPMTGFVNLFDVKYESVEKAKAFFSRFDFIRYQSDKDWFEFEFDYNHFTKKAEGTKTRWTLCTYGTRIRTFRNVAKNSQWDNEEINLTDAFKSLFAKFNVDIHSNLKEELSGISEKEFFVELIHLFKLTLQMRNSVTGTDIDYLISPVMAENGDFYDSRKADDSLPRNADANGAYNIARKGLMLQERIRKSDDPEKINFKITNKEWLDFAQNL